MVTMESLYGITIALTIDDSLRPPFSKMGSKCNPSDLLHFFVLGRVFGVGGSNGTISGSIKPKMSAMT